MLDKFEESGGEETDELTELLAINRNDVQEKVDEQLVVLQTLEDENERLKATAKRIASRKDSNDKMIEKIKKNIVVALDMYSEGKLKTDAYSLTIKRTKALKIFDVNAVPKKFVRYTLDLSVNDEIRKELYRILARFAPTFTAKVDANALKKAVESGEAELTTGFDIMENQSLVRR